MFSEKNSTLRIRLDREKRILEIKKSHVTPAKIITGWFISNCIKWNIPVTKMAKVGQTNFVIFFGKLLKKKIAYTLSFFYIK